MARIFNNLEWQEGKRFSQKELETDRTSPGQSQNIDRQSKFT
jgi:hypothetical protein